MTLWRKLYQTLRYLKGTEMFLREAYCLDVHLNLREMKTYRKKIKLHKQAVKLIKVIDYAKKRKDAIYGTYRNFAMVHSRDDMFKMYHRLEILDMAIDRLKKRYVKIIDELCIL
jgi:hypothetical protein